MLIKNSTSRFKLYLSCFSRGRCWNLSVSNWDDFNRSFYGWVIVWKERSKIWRVRPKGH